MSVPSLPDAGAELPPLLCIVGPTAAGKTAAAVAVAQRWPAEVISCDSVQVYAGMDIGSAKPSVAERRAVPHHLLDVRTPDEPLDAAGWAALADREIEAIRRRERKVIVCGGTGLWLRALLRGLVPTPPVDPVLREELTRRAEAEGIEALHAELARTDPVMAERLAPRDRQRILRALEVHTQTGQRLSELQDEHNAGTPRYRAVVAFLDPERESLYARIDRRVEQMMKAGLLAEVRSLVARYGTGARPLEALGYVQLVRHLRAELSLEEAVATIQRDTRRYAKRQRTWFKGMDGIRCCPPDTVEAVALEAFGEP